MALRDVSFSLQPGETLGFAGVDGNGQAELAAAPYRPAPLAVGKRDFERA